MGHIVRPREVYDPFPYPPTVRDQNLSPPEVEGTTFIAVEAEEGMDAIRVAVMVAEEGEAMIFTGIEVIAVEVM